MKTNPDLEWAVVTGCLRITKESIFIGLNNLDINSILSANYAEYFGFTEEEVRELLTCYNRADQMDTMQSWYDGYLFGHEEIYNPWSVIMYTKALAADEYALPGPFWANTSSNSIVKDLVEQADASVKGELKCLIEGQTIEKPVHEDITYEDIYRSKDNLWNFLFFTGYLKQVGKRMAGDTPYIELAIPNLEVRYIYKNTIMSWFEQKMTGTDLTGFYRCLENKDTEGMEAYITGFLQETISFYDYAESYYHGFMTGLFKNMSNYRVISNREQGLGRPDIILKTPSVRGRAIILELKTASRFQDMEKGCHEAIEQIRKQNYEAGLREEGYSEIASYGVCFYKKECRIRRNGRLHG